jgi:hypothetical protein
MSEPRTCLFCEHFYLRPAQPGYSEYTPSEAIELRCVKRHWELEPYETTLPEFRRMLLKAETCADFSRMQEPMP